MAAKLASIFEIRAIISIVLGLIGLFLLLVGIVDPSPNTYLIGMARHIDSNLWAGGGLLVIAIIMFVWLKLDPTGGAAPKQSKE